MESAADIRALLAWYEAMGVDATVQEAPPALRTVAPATAPGGAGRAGGPARAAPKPVARPPAVAPPSGPDRPGLLAGEGGGALGVAEAVAAARAAAEACSTLDQLTNAIRGFDGCALKPTATTTVVSDGHPQAPVMVMGEAPGAEEDRQGLPFVGRSGQLLDRMLAAIGLARHAEDPTTAVYISNVIPWRPPGNRQPSASEMAVCLPFAQRHIALQAPKVLILMGGTAAKGLLGETMGIVRLRGQWRDMAVPGLAAPVRAIATFHPAYLLRQPAQKREVWADLLAVKAALEEG